MVVAGAGGVTDTDGAEDTRTAGDAALTASWIVLPSQPEDGVLVEVVTAVVVVTETVVAVVTGAVVAVGVVTAVVVTAAVVDVTVMTAAVVEEAAVRLVARM